MTDIFDGKIAIVTGGTSVIGYAVSEELLKRGATVW
jgi:NAD(P)-dependent dehydrogenase (short-subunit alcohol dehydrogenase family)